MNRSIFVLLLLGYLSSCLANPTLGILTDWNLYFARIIELNASNDHFELFYHHNDPVYSLQSFTSNNRLQRMTLCSASTIYTLDIRFGSEIVPWLSIDDTPCRSSLMYLFNESVLLWNWRHKIVRMDLLEMRKTIFWNSTSIIGHVISNESIENNWIDFYLSIESATNQSSILHCRLDRHTKSTVYQTACLFLDHGYRHISTLAVDNNRLYVADRTEKQIYALTLSLNNVLLTKTILPLNTSTIADIQSMLIVDQYLIWLTTSGHIRLVSLRTNHVRNLFWFNEPLQTIGLVMTFTPWPSRTSISQTTTVTTSSSNVSTRILPNIDDKPWKITAYVTSIILGFALFLSAILMTCLVLHYRLARIDPARLTNPFNILQSVDNRDFISIINQ